MSPLPPRFLCRAAAALALLAASSCWVDPALRLHVSVPSSLRASCVKVLVYPSSDVSGTAAGEALVTRADGADDLYVGIYKRTLPGQVWITAQAMFGAECANPLVPNGPAAQISASFPSSGVTPVDLAIPAPTAAEDADGDGFVGLPGGRDCNDGNRDVNPGATERCQEAVDYNCDGRVGCADPTCPATACVATPTQLGFVTAPKTQLAGDCSAGPITVETRNSGGAAMNVVVPTTVTFGTPDGNLSLFADSLCRNALTGITIAAGNARADAYVRGTISGTARVTASAPGMTAAEQTHTIQPGPIAQLVFTSPAQAALPLNQCSEPATVQLRDSFGNPSPVSAARTLTLSSDASPGTSFRFYPDALCALPVITATPVAVGAATSAFHFKSTATSPGPVVITVADGVRTATQTETLVQRTPTRLEYITGPFPVALGACSPAVTLQTQDAAGLPAPVTSLTNIPLSTAGAAVTLHSNSTCTSNPINQVSIAASTNSASFYFKGSVQGPVTITANGGSFGSAAQTETITAPVATQLAFATAPRTVSAGACSGPVEIESRDGNGVPIAVSAATQVDLTVAPIGQLSFYSSSSCTGTAITSATLAAGTSKVTVYFRGTVAGSSTVTASTPGGALTPAQQVETVTPAAADRIIILASSKGQTLASGACGSITIELQDPFGNPVNASPSQTVNLSSSPAPGVSFFSTMDCSGGAVTSAQIASGASRSTFRFRGTTSGTYTVVEDPVSASLAGDTAPETITGGTATALAFTSPAQNAVPAGTCSQPVTLTSQDAVGNTAPVSGNTSITPGSTGLTGVTFYSNATCGTAVTTVNIPNMGTSVTYYFRTSTPGTGTLTAGVSGLTPPTAQPVAVVAGAPTRLVFTLGPVTVPAGTCSGAAPGFPLAIETRDANGNPAPVTANTDVAISGVNDGGTITFHTTTGCSGNATTLRISPTEFSTGSFYFKTNKAGTWALTGSFTGLTSATQNETVTPGPPAALGYTSPAQSVAANDCSARVTFEVQDQYGNLSPPTSTTTVNLTPGTDTFYRNSACNQALSGNTVTMNTGQLEGQYWFLAPNAPGTNYTIGIGSTGLTSASQQETIP